MKITEHTMMLLPPSPDVCQKCAVSHGPSMPHDQTSLYWQMWYNQAYGRFPTWHDAMEHCDDEMKRIWIEELKKRGVEI